jgi:hypothetical protein
MDNNSMWEINPELYRLREKEIRQQKIVARMEMIGTVLIVPFAPVLLILACCM